jgi:hypothetical protein
LNDGRIQNPSNPFGIVPLSRFVPRGFGFVHHSIAILYYEVPNPNLTIRNFFIAVRRTCTPRLGLHSCRGESARVAKRPRERISHPKTLPSRFAAFLHIAERCRVKRIVLWFAWAGERTLRAWCAVRATPARRPWAAWAAATRAPPPHTRPAGLVWHCQILPLKPAFPCRF